MKKFIQLIICRIYEEWTSWAETLSILMDRRLMKDIRQAEEDIKAGRVYTMEQVFRER